jgi:hypothetical protein
MREISGNRSNDAGSSKRRDGTAVVALDVAQAHVLEAARSLYHLSQAVAVAPPAFQLISRDVSRFRVATGDAAPLRRDVRGLVALAQAVVRSSVSALLLLGTGLEQQQQREQHSVRGEDRDERSVDDDDFVLAAVAMSNSARWTRGERNEESALRHAITETHLCLDLSAADSGATALTSRCIFRALHMAKISAALHDALMSPIQSRATASGDFPHRGIAPSAHPTSSSSSVMNLDDDDDWSPLPNLSRRNNPGSPPVVVTFNSVLSNVVGEYSTIAAQTEKAAAALWSLGQPLPTLALCVIARTLQLEMQSIQMLLESHRRIRRVRGALRALSTCVWDHHYRDQLSQQDAAASILDDTASREGDGARWSATCVNAVTRLRDAVAISPAASITLTLTPRATAWMDVGTAACAATEAALTFDWPRVLRQTMVEEKRAERSSLEFVHRHHDQWELYHAVVSPLREYSACMMLIDAIRRSPITMYATDIRGSPRQQSVKGPPSQLAGLDELASSPLVVARNCGVLTLPGAIALAKTLVASLSANTDDTRKQEGR